MRKALIVGINDYGFAPLNACIADATKMYNILGRDFDNSPNFHSKLLVSSNETITIGLLTDAIEELFSNDSEVALFYFSGHGSEQTKTSSACLVTQDAQKHSEGVPLNKLLEIASQSKAKEKIFILDCCFSGNAGGVFINEDFAFLPEGTSILTSSRKNQVSFENAGGGIFTNIIINALDGGAADTIGLVNIAGIYSYADKLLGPWDQRPVFKAHVAKMICLRKCKPSVPLEILRKMTTYFPQAEYIYPLDPSYEPEAEPKGHDNEKIFADLQKFNRTNLLVPVDAEHLYFAAINYKSCELTPLGKYYWKLVNEGMI